MLMLFRELHLQVLLMLLLLLLKLHLQVLLMLMMFELHLQVLLMLMLLLLVGEWVPQKEIVNSQQDGGHADGDHVE